MDDFPDKCRDTEFDLLAGQFVLTGAPAAVPATWLKAELDDWHLAHHPLLPLVPLRALDDSTLGWLLGHAISQDAALLDGPQVVPVNSRSNVDVTVFEDWLYMHSGRFVAVLLTEQHARVYLDALGSLACVYARDHPAVGATTSVLSAIGAVDTTATGLADLPLKRNQYYPAGLTSHPGVRRLFCNHYLDLDRWISVRHWLNQPYPEIDEDDFDAHAAQFVRDMARTINAVAKRYDVYLCLTAGRDSRAVLASARQVADRVTAVSYAIPTNSGRVDVRVAAAVARSTGVHHVVAPVETASQASRLDYLRGIGFDGHWGKARKFRNASEAHLDLGNAILTGHGSSTGKTMGWPPGLTGEPWRGDASQLLNSLKLSQTPTNRAAMADWLDTVPSCSARQLFSQLRLENRTGCCESPHYYGFAPFAAILSPYSSRAIQETLLRLPVPEQQGQRYARFQTAVIDHAWPALARLPYQRMPGLSGNLEVIAGKVMDRGKSMTLRLMRG